ncbi:hypothetical protein NQ317_016951 [Molorchus minor]|uniref:Nucleolar protein 14 n=1 Tax=Molorchus minor TaxID=1323400 RepID=A0ABQ9K687_9CUCU|nr:hypothetical protein NQ317_016951 [Molorchus minor]
MLNKCKVQNKRDISYGLFLVTLVAEYTVLSKRYLPAVVNFLSGLLHMAIPKSGVRLFKIIPPFKSTSSLLVLLKDYNSESFNSYSLDSRDLLNNEIEEDYKVRVLYNSLKLLQNFYSNFAELSSRIEIFNLPEKFLNKIPTTNYPKEVKELMEDFRKTLKQGKTDCKLEYVFMEAKKPKALRLYEPKIQEVYEGKKFKVQSKAKAERDKLLHKLKKETKGALREIRRDRAFLGRVKVQEKIQSDKERHEKVKRIYAEAAMQQNELKELDRKKKKKK